MYTPAVSEAGIPLEWRHDPAHVVGPGGGAIVDRIAVSKALTSVDPDLPELVAAREAGIPAISCQQLIADAAATRGARLIAVSGTHGKSTTTGWLLHLLLTAGEDPTAFVGALMPSSLTGGEPSSIVAVDLSSDPAPFAPDEPAATIYKLRSFDRPVVTTFLERAASWPGT